MVDVQADVEVVVLTWQHLAQVPHSGLTLQSIGPELDQLLPIPAPHLGELRAGGQRIGEPGLGVLVAVIAQVHVVLEFATGRQRAPAKVLVDVGVPIWVANPDVVVQVRGIIHRDVELDGVGQLVTRFHCRADPHPQDDAVAPICGQRWRLQDELAEGALVIVP